MNFELMKLFFYILLRGADKDNMNKNNL